MTRAIRQHLVRATAGDEGFTLIELLIVVVILGVLSGVVVFAVGAFNNDGVLAACKADKKSVEVAAEVSYAKSTAATPVHAPTILALVNAGYLKEEPNSPKYTINYAVTAATATTPETVAVTSTLAGC